MKIFPHEYRYWCIFSRVDTGTINSIVSKHRFEKWIQQSDHKMISVHIFVEAGVVTVCRYLFVGPKSEHQDRGKVKRNWFRLLRLVEEGSGSGWCLCRLSGWGSRYWEAGGLDRGTYEWDVEDQRGILPGGRDAGGWAAGWLWSSSKKSHEVAWAVCHIYHGDRWKQRMKRSAEYSSWLWWLNELQVCERQKLQTSREAAPSLCKKHLWQVQIITGVKFV